MSITVKEFYADWFGKCEDQRAIINSLKDEYQYVRFDRINVDNQQEIANQYQVRELPTIIIEHDGSTIDRFVGFTQSTELEKALNSADATTEPDSNSGTNSGGNSNSQINFSGPSPQKTETVTQENTSSSETKVFEDPNSETQIYDPSSPQKHTAEELPSFCPGCGNSLTSYEDVSFCPDCGISLTS